MNRQYIVTHDEFDQDSDSITDHHKGYTVREVVYPMPPDDFLGYSPNRCSSTDLYRYSTNDGFFNYKLDNYYTSQNELFSNGLKFPSEKGDSAKIDIDNIPKVNQKSKIYQDKSINTSAEFTCASTQTPENNYLFKNNNSFITHCNSQFSNHYLEESDVIHYANEIAEILRLEASKESYTDIDNESSDKDSYILTYSINKSPTRTKSSNESYYSPSISNSLEYMSEESNIDEAEPEEFKSVPKKTPESDMLRFFNNEPTEECIRVSYLPAEMISSLSHFTNEIWNYHRVFEIKEFDEIIKSHQVRSDRRLKAISNRMLCKIDIIGPYKSSYSHFYLRNAMQWYNLVIYATSKIRLEKAINCIQLSFPTSCFNEKRYKSQNTLQRY